MGELNRKHNLLITFLLLEEDDDEDMLLSTYRNRNKKVNELFSSRKAEGAYNLTVQQRLFENNTKFLEYFRLSRELFEIVLSFIRADITKKQYNRRSCPIY